MESGRSLERKASDERNVFKPVLSEVIKKIADKVIDLSGDSSLPSGPVSTVAVSKVSGRSGISRDGRLFKIDFLDPAGKSIADAEISLDVTAFGVSLDSFQGDRNES